MELFLPVVLFSGFAADLVSGEIKYFLEGGNVTLAAPAGTPSPITAVIWRHGDNLAAEWSGDHGQQAYREFKGRAQLDSALGHLVLSRMAASMAGRYSVEINNQRLGDEYQVELIERPPLPDLWSTPGATADQVTLICDGEVGKAGPVAYFWNLNGTWVRREKRIVVSRAETAELEETFLCKIENPLAQGVSKPLPNPFAPASTADSRALWALLLLLLLPAGVAVCGFWKKDWIKEKCGARGGADVTPAGVPLNSPADG